MARALQLIRMALGSNSATRVLMMPELDQVEREIADAVLSIGIDGSRDQWTSDRMWTSEVKRRIGELGRNKGFQICASGWTPPHGRGEWLYDLMWLQLKNDHIVGVPLVLESEWSQDLGNIDWDFCKLLLGRAAHRVMVFQQRSEEDVMDVFDHLAAQISSFAASSPGDRYLLLGYDRKSTRGFNHRLIIT